MNPHVKGWRFIQKDKKYLFCTFYHETKYGSSQKKGGGGFASVLLTLANPHLTPSY